MATVFLARLEGVAGFQRLCAIKRLHPHLANEAEFVDMFLDEARLAARIHHPNVVSILEVGTSDQGYYLVMEYIEGDTAARLLARCTQTGGHIPPASAVRIALDTLFGLHAAHELTDDAGLPLHIVHRDVSPQNILVGIDGVSRITDFGVAHAATRLSSTRTGQLKGKLAYMAPEQARGVPVDRRADVFAMGVVLWELLAGKRLFKAGNDAETLHRILFAPIPTPRDAGIDIPIPLQAVCMRALARETADRYASAAEFADDLERVARSASMLSTTREIASYVDKAIGAEISQQREVVRGWMSRSEPSRNDRINVPLGPDSRWSLRGPTSEDSAARAARKLASSRDVTLSAPASPVASAPPVLLAVPAPSRGDVSSVSSAVLQLPEATTTDSKVLFPPADIGVVPASPDRRRVVALGAGVAALAMIAAVGVALRPGGRVDRGGVTASTSPLPPATPASAASVPSVPIAAAPPAVAAAPPDAGLASQAPGTRPTRTPTRGGAAARPGRPTSAPTSDDLDDLSRNPYR